MTNETQPTDEDADLTARGGAAGAELDDRSVIGGAAREAGVSQASPGAFDTEGGGDLGGSGSRDPGDSTGRFSPETASADFTKDDRPADPPEDPFGGP